jgi:hypothetical protein
MMTGDVQAVRVTCVCARACVLRVCARAPVCVRVCTLLRSAAAEKIPSGVVSRWARTFASFLWYC